MTDLEVAATRSHRRSGREARSVGRADRAALATDALRPITGASTPFTLARPHAAPAGHETRERGSRTRATLVLAAQLLGVGVAFLAAWLLRDAGPVVWWCALGAGLLLAFEFAAIPVYARARSLRPIKRLVWFGGAFLLVGTIADRLTHDQVRAAAVVLASAGAVIATSVALHRVTERARTTLLVGDVEGVGHLVNQWRTSHEVDVQGICLVGGDEHQPTEIDGVPVLGDLAAVADVAQRLDVHEVVAAPGRTLSAYDVRKLSWALARTGVELTVAAEVHGAVPSRIEPRLLGKRLLLSVRPGHRPWPARIAKGLIDRIGAAVLLVLLAPVFATITALVRIDSPGPIVFRQRRAGLGGAEFTMLKFRTMVDGAEAMLDELREHNESAGPLFKIREDPRITKVGRFLRRTSLDELPQIVNVLRGEMSLIGPRPGLPAEAETYDAWIRHRLTVKPGMTGAWQVGGRSRLEWNESVRMDLDYVDNHTLTGNLVIAAKTVRAVLRQDGA